MFKLTLFLSLFIFGCSSITFEQTIERCGLKGNWQLADISLDLKNKLLLFSDGGFSVIDNLSSATGKTNDLWLKNSRGDIAVCRHNNTKGRKGITPYAIFRKAENTYELKENSVLACCMH